MLRFEDPIFLWLLWIIPVLILIRLIGWRRRKAKLKKLGDLFRPARKQEALYGLPEERLVALCGDGCELGK
jgi:hypothetical protein